MTDAETLVRYVSCLARHIEQAEELGKYCHELLFKTQNAETCDARPTKELWEECARIIEAAGIAVRLCKERSEKLRWNPDTTSKG